MNVYACSWLLLTMVCVEQAIMDYFAWNARREDARVISRQFKTLFFHLYLTKMRCSVLEKVSCFIWRASNFISGTLKWKRSQKIFQIFVLPPHIFSAKRIHLNLPLFAYSFDCPFQLMKSHMKGFTQSSQSQSLVIQLQQNYFLKYWGLFFFFPFFFLVSMIVCV